MKEIENKQVYENSAAVAKVAEQEVQIKQLIKLKEKLVSIITDLNAQLEQVIQSKDEAVNLGVIRQKQISHWAKIMNEQLLRDRDERTGLVLEYQKLIEQLLRDRDEQTEQLLRDRDEQTKQSLQKKNQRISELESEVAEKNHRQRLLNQELSKAEVQLELIKDVLLREPHI